MRTVTILITATLLGLAVVASMEARSEHQRRVRLRLDALRREP